MKHTIKEADVLTLSELLVLDKIDLVHIITAYQRMSIIVDEIIADERKKEICK